MNSVTAGQEPIEVAWFSALCDDDYEFLGVPDPTLQSSWDHCASIVTAADRHGYDNVLLPSGYALGIDNAAFAAAIASSAVSTITETPLPNTACRAVSGVSSASNCLST